MLKNKISEARNKKGWTQEKLANKLGVSRSYIAEIETGKFIPKLSLLSRMAEILELDKNEIFSIASEDMAQREQIKLRQKIKEPQAIYSNLPDKVQSLIKKHPEIIEALDDPIAIKVLLSVHKGDGNIKKAYQVILNLSKKKQQAILSLLEGFE